MKKLAIQLLLVGALVFVVVWTLNKCMSESFSWFNHWGLFIGEIVAVSLAIVVMLAREVRKACSSMPKEVEERWQQMIELTKTDPQIFKKSPFQSSYKDQKKFWLLYNKPLPEGWGIGWVKDSKNTQKILMLRENGQELETVREYIISESEKSK